MLASCRLTAAGTLGRSIKPPSGIELVAGGPGFIGTAMAPPAIERAYCERKSPESHRGFGIMVVCTENLNPHVTVMKPAKDWV